jgi:hypothetical protein
MNCSKTTAYVLYLVSDQCREAKPAQTNPGYQDDDSRHTGTNDYGAGVSHGVNFTL